MPIDYAFLHIFKISTTTTTATAIFHIVTRQQLLRLVEKISLSARAFVQIRRLLWTKVKLNKWEESLRRSCNNDSMSRSAFIQFYLQTVNYCKRSLYEQFQRRLLWNYNFFYCILFINYLHLTIPTDYSLWSFFVTAAAAVFMTERSYSHSTFYKWLGNY